MSYEEPFQEILREVRQSRQALGAKCDGIEHRLTTIQVEQGKITERQKISADDILALKMDKAHKDDLEHLRVRVDKVESNLWKTFWTFATAALAMLVYTAKWAWEHLFP